MEVKQPNTGMTTTTVRQKAQTLKAVPHVVEVDSNVVMIVMTAQMK